MQFPTGIESISIERQTFGVEFRDDAGAYFRVPDHFVPQLMALSLGFATCDRPPGTDLDDLPRADPLRDGAISDQAKKIEVLETELNALRTDLSVTAANLSAVLAERDDLKLRLHEAEVKISDLEDEAVELREAANRSPEKPATKSKYAS